MEDGATSRPDWPEADLELVQECPACGCPDREILHVGVMDYLCRTPGKWNLYRCRDCGSAYLDPRPTPASIGRVYDEYVTHSFDHRLRDERTGLAKKLKRQIEHAYLQRRYAGISWLRHPTAPLIRLFPAWRGKIDGKMRYMPAIAGQGRLLDLGCGNGDFLLRAGEAGWNAVGVDSDPQAVELARSRGLPAWIGDVEAAAVHAPFDGIALSHVIEHVYDPRSVLRRCREMLNPGAWLWLETPNIDAEGHRLFGPFWRGLEPPRHLTLFNSRALYALLEEAGFTGIERLPCRAVCRGMFRESSAFARKAGYQPIGAETSVDGLAERAEKLAGDNPDAGEFIALRAWKPVHAGLP